MKEKMYKLTQSQKVLRYDEMGFSEKEPPKVNTLGVYVYVKRDFSPECMEKAFWCIVERNDSFRLRIVKKGLSKRQIIKPFQRGHLEIIRTDDGESFLQRVRKYPKRFMQMTDDELCTADIIIDGESSGGIIMIFHHICADGYSYDLIIKKLKSYYLAYLGGGEPEEEKLYSISDCFSASEKYLASKQHKKDRSWWIKNYHGQKDYCLPIGARSSSSTCAIAEFGIDGELLEKVRAFSKITGVSSNSLFLTAAAITTARLTGKRNFAIYNMFHGRMTASQKRTVGCVMVTVPMMFNVKADDDTVSDFFRRAYKDFLAGASHSRIPFAELIAIMYPKCLKCRSFAHEWLCFSQMDYRSDGDDLFESSALPHFGLECQLYMAVLEGENDINIEIEYQDKIFTSLKVTEIWEAYRRTLSDIVNDPDAPMKQITSKQ